MRDIKTLVFFSYILSGLFHLLSSIFILIISFIIFIVFLVFYSLLL